MRVAGPIILGVVGAILAFAITADLSGVAISTVGFIMLVAAGIWFVIEVINGATGSRTTETVRHQDGTVEQRQRTTRNTEG